MNTLLSLLLLVIQTNVPLLENDYLRVFKNAVVCSVPSSECGDRVIVALSAINVGGDLLERGQVRVFGPGQSYNRPEGGEFLEVVIATNRPDVAVPPETIRVPNYNRTLYEGVRFRVIEGRLRPGDGRERHSHNQRLIVVLNRTRLLQKPDEGAEFFSDFVPDDVSFAEPLIHAMRNVGEELLRNIVVELKP